MGFLLPQIVLFDSAHETQIVMTCLAVVIPTVANANFVLNQVQLAKVTKSANRQEYTKVHVLYQHNSIVIILIITVSVRMKFLENLIIVTLLGQI